MSSQSMNILSPFSQRATNASFMSCLEIPEPTPFPKRFKKSFRLRGACGFSFLTSLRALRFSSHFSCLIWRFRAFLD